MYEEAKIRVDSLIATANKKKALMMLKTYAERIRDAAPSLKGVKELPEDLFLVRVECVLIRFEASKDSSLSIVALYRSLPAQCSTQLGWCQERYKRWMRLRI